MSDQRPGGVWVNSNLFNENSSKISFEELQQYVGQVIAWTLDGTRILAAGADELEVERKLKEMGIDASEVVFDNVPPGDTLIV